MTEKHKMNVPETMNEVLDMSDDEGTDLHKERIASVLLLPLSCHQFTDVVHVFGGFSKYL